VIPALSFGHFQRNSFHIGRLKNIERCVFCYVGHMHLIFLLVIVGMVRIQLVQRGTTSYAVATALLPEIYFLKFLQRRLIFTS